MNEKVFVFRIAHDSDYVQKELKSGRLRQGWGWDQTNLIGIDKDQWVDKQCGQDDSPENKKYYGSKYNNLRIMLDINPGDILIIPKAPDSSQFTICRASGKYAFIKPEGFGKNDFYHMIPVDSIRQYNYHSNEYTGIIHAKLRSYQSPLNNVWNQTVKDAAIKLLLTEQTTEYRPTSDIISEIKKDVFEGNVLQRFRDLGSRETEYIVDLIFQNLGYEFIGRNSWDGTGGDADLIYQNNALSEFIENSVNASEISGKIYVQIKNKTGMDNGDMEGIDQLIKRTDGISGCTKILISTAKRFSDECIRAANRNNILLIDGIGFLKLVFKYID